MIEQLNNSVWCKIAPSPIHGVGVFAIRDIPKGTLVTDYSLTDIVLRKEVPVFEMSEDEFLQITPCIRDLILDRQVFNGDREKMIFISPNYDIALQSYMNHSSNPNTQGSIALRDISQGEELTEDFSMITDTLHELNSKHYLPFLHG